MPDKTKSDESGSKGRAGCDCPLCGLREFWNQQTDSEVWKHFSKAQEEFLLGLKAVIDSRLQKVQSKPGKKEPRVTKVKVE